MNIEPYLADANLTCQIRNARNWNRKQLQNL